MSQSEPIARDLPRGKLFADRYEIGDVLGRGGMGAVYRARDLALGEVIALKVLALGSEAGMAEVMRFRQEVRLSRKVTHPNVARVFDIGEHEGLVFLTMELVEGETLRQALKRRGALPPAEATEVLRAICAGLKAAHAVGVIHRDLKPANVMIDAAGRVVLTDFGIARSLDETSSLTAGAIGTPMYMAPEQLFSGAVDARTDIYALGVLLHEIVTGTRPGATDGRAALPGAIEAVVRRCTAPIADARPGSIDEVLRLLDGGAPPPSGEATVALGPARAEAARDDQTRPLPRAADPGPITSAAKEPALAVLPFRYRGPKEEEGFGDAITDELVDMLSRTRGLRVLGTGATARFREARDPIAIGRESAASVVIDGSAQISGERVRITVRLLDASSGVQIWTARYDGDLGDLLSLQETIAHRVAEELRLELTTRSHGVGAPPAAIELYLDARRRLRAFEYESAASAVEKLDHALALAPDFTPALAAHAIASLRAWYWDMQGSEIDLEAAARASVARAVERAPELAETHLAAGVLATQSGDYRGAATAIHRALAIAPTFADAHEYLAMLECEAGRADDGARRLTLAGSLDPTLMYYGVFLARTQALRGRWAEAEATLADMERRHGPAVSRIVAAQRGRQAAWRGDLAALRALADDDSFDAWPSWRTVRLYARALVGEVEDAELRERVKDTASRTQNPRTWSLMEQLATEIYGARGDVAEAELHLTRAAASVLVDLDWLDRCPLLGLLRERPGWAEIRRKVSARAEAVWRT